MNFVKTTHARERLEQHFPLLNHNEEMKTIVVCGKDEELALKQSKSYKNIKKGEKDNYQFYKTASRIFLVTRLFTSSEKKKKSNKGYNGVLITVINVDAKKESLITADFKKKSILADYEIRKLNALTPNERKKEVVLTQEEIEKKEAKKVAKKARKAERKALKMKTLHEDTIALINQKLASINKLGLFSKEVSLSCDLNDLDINQVKQVKASVSVSLKAFGEYVYLKELLKEGVESNNPTIAFLEWTEKDTKKWKKMISESVLTVRSMKRFENFDEMSKEFAEKTFDLMSDFYYYQIGTINKSQMFEMISYLKVADQREQVNTDKIAEAMVSYYDWRMTETFDKKPVVSMYKVNKTLSNMRLFYSKIPTDKLKKKFDGIYNFFELLVSHMEKMDIETLDLKTMKAQ